MTSGKATVQNGQDALCTAKLNASGVGTCSLTTSQLAAATYSSIKAVYPGVAGKINSSMSAAAKLVVSASATPILPPVITSLDSSTCFGRVLSGTTTVGFSSCPSLGSSILVNGRNFFYTTTLTPGLCQSLYYVTFFQLLCLLPSAAPGTTVNVQAFTPGMGQTAPTGFTVGYLSTPTISSLTNTACAGTQIGLALNGCPSVGGSQLVIKGANFLPSSTVTTGLCSNVVWIDVSTLYCTVSSGLAPGTTVNVVVNTLAGSSPATGINISF